MLKKCEKENVETNEVGTHREWGGMGGKKGGRGAGVGARGNRHSLSLLLNGAQTLRTEVTVSLRCQPAQAVVPSDSAKHRPGCHWAVLEVRLTSAMNRLLGGRL